MLTRQWQPWNIPVPLTVVLDMTWHGWCDVLTVMVMMVLSTKSEYLPWDGWRWWQVNSGYVWLTDWLSLSPCFTSSLGSGWSTTDKKRREEKSSELARSDLPGTETWVPGGETGPPGDGYRFTGYSTTSSTTTTVRLSVSYGGSGDQARLVVPWTLLDRRKVSF